MRAIIEAGRVGCQEETNKLIDGEFNEAEEVVIGDALSRLLYSAGTGGLLLESEAEDAPDIIEGGDNNDEDDDETEGSGGEDGDNGIPPEVEEALKEFQQTLDEHANKQQKFLETYLFNKRQFILYYVEGVPHDKDDIQGLLLNRDKYDTDMSNIIKVLEPLNPNIFEKLLTKYQNEFNGKINPLQERYGYFVLCYGTPEKRQMKVYENIEIAQKRYDLESLYNSIRSIEEKTIEAEFEKLFKKKEEGQLSEEA